MAKHRTQSLSSFSELIIRWSQVRIWRAHQHHTGAQCEWEIYQARLRSLELKEPALKFSPDVKKAMSADVMDCKGARYKILDDLLDGIFCAYLAYYFWHWGREGSWVVGDTESGSVTLPRCRLPNCPLTVGVNR